MADAGDAEQLEDDAPQGEEAPRGEDWEYAVEASPFARCATCVSATEVDLEQGTVLCTRHSMHVDAEADEIPDDCPEYQRDPNKPVPADLTEESSPGGQP